MRFSRYLGLLLFLLFSVDKSSAQNHSFLGYFTASEKNGNVFLSWQIVSGSTCTGIQIYRSADSVTFTQIGDIAGVCGNVSSAENYDFTDLQPLQNKTNYYRLELGNYGFSQTVAVTIIDLTGDGYQVRPNPVSNTAQIYFDNSKNERFCLSIYSTLGMGISTLFTESDFFDVQAAHLPPGAYFFNIADVSLRPKIQGRFIVQH